MFNNVLSIDSRAIDNEIFQGCITALQELEISFGKEQGERLMNMFCETVKSEMEHLGQFVIDADSLKVQKVSHGLRGMCATVGIDVLELMFAEMENCAAKLEVENVNSLLLEIEATFNEVERALSICLGNILP